MPPLHICLAYWIFYEAGIGIYGRQIPGGGLRIGDGSRLTGLWCFPQSGANAPQESYFGHLKDSIMESHKEAADFDSVNSIMDVLIIATITLSVESCKAVLQ